MFKGVKEVFYIEFTRGYLCVRSKLLLLFIHIMRYLTKLFSPLVLDYLDTVASKAANRLKKEMFKRRMVLAKTLTVEAQKNVQTDYSSTYVGGQ